MDRDITRAQGWRLVVREPRGGQMRGVINHEFTDLAAAVAHLAEFVHRLCGRDEIKICLLGEGDDLAGYYVCAWPFFADLLAPQGLDNAAIMAHYREMEQS